MQGFWVSQAGVRGSILLFSIDKKSTFTLCYLAVPAVHDRLHAVGLVGVGEPRQRREPWGERQRSPHSLRGSWEHVERGRERGCSQHQHQHPFPAAAGTAEAQGVLLGALAGKKARRKGWASSWKGWREQNCFGDPNNHEKGSCDVQIIDCSTSDNRHKVFSSL